MIRLTVPDIRQEDIDAVVDVLRSGMLVQGPRVAELETFVAGYLGCKHAIAVSSGTAALHLALVALDVGPGDAVLVPAFSFIATANVVELVGARPVFVDVDSRTYNMAPAELEATLANWAYSERPRVIMPVHEFGCPADMRAIGAIAAEQHLTVVEDAACALGARCGARAVGTFGRIACFSFHPRKSVTTGEGGLLVTDDEGLAERLRLLRNHGMSRHDGRMDFTAAGYNYRMSDIHAALGLGQLRRLEAGLRARQALAARYIEALADVPRLALPEPVPGHAWQSFMIVLDPTVHRNKLFADLRARDIEVNVGAQAIHRERFFADKYPEYADVCPVAVRCAELGTVLPLYQELLDRTVSLIASGVRECLTP